MGERGGGGEQAAGSRSEARSASPETDRQRFRSKSPISSDRYRSDSVRDLRPTQQLTKWQILRASAWSVGRPVGGKYTARLYAPL